MPASGDELLHETIVKLRERSERAAATLKENETSTYRAYKHTPAPRGGGGLLPNSKRKRSAERMRETATLVLSTFFRGRPNRANELLDAAPGPDSGNSPYEQRQLVEMVDEQLSAAAINQRVTGHLRESTYLINCIHDDGFRSWCVAEHSLFLAQMAWNEASAGNLETVQLAVRAAPDRNARLLIADFVGPAVFAQIETQAKAGYFLPTSDFVGATRGPLTAGTMKRALDIYVARKAHQFAEMGAINKAFRTADHAATERSRRSLRAALREAIRETVRSETDQTAFDFNDATAALDGRYRSIFVSLGEDTTRRLVDLIETHKASQDQQDAASNPARTNDEFLIEALDVLHKAELQSNNRQPAPRLLSDFLAAYGALMAAERSASKADPDQGLT